MSSTLNASIARSGRLGRFPDHMRGFWAALGTAMPDYEARRDTLRRMGRAMVW